MCYSGFFSGGVDTGWIFLPKTDFMNGSTYAPGGALRNRVTPKKLFDEVLHAEWDQQDATR
jgi:hypothetical protein